MKLENNVCSLQLSMKLHELGIKQKSLFVWEYLNETAYAIKYFPYAVVKNDFDDYKLYSAYIASELLEMLPYSVFIRECEPLGNFRLSINKSFTVTVSLDESLTKKTNYIVNYYCDSLELPGEDSFFREKLFKNICDENICDALAKTLIKLIEGNKL